MQNEVFKCITSLIQLCFFVSINLRAWQKTELYPSILQSNRLQILTKTNGILHFFRGLYYRSWRKPTVFFISLEKRPQIQKKTELCPSFLQSDRLHILTKTNGTLHCYRTIDPRFRRKPNCILHFFRAIDPTFWWILNSIPHFFYIDPDFNRTVFFICLYFSDCNKLTIHFLIVP